VNEGAGALRLLARDAIDVLIADIRMPGVTGLELIKAVRKLSRRGPAIAVTAYPEEKQRALAAGFDVCLSKPIDPLELVREVARRIPGRTTQP
jgi:CheY-like chemotaxis protein